ncbi:MAG: tetratricopeptide repeat protein [Acidobacteria bacterium]|nr:tetratricopeptide repeat protein [Acidobacteriota bacterium]
MEPAVRRQVEAAYLSLAAAKDRPAPEAAADFGEAGKTFLLYSLVEAALPCFENAAALAPQDFHWAYFAGLAARQRGDLDRAGSHLRHALALRPELPAALIRLGEVEILRGDLDSAQRAYSAATAFPGTAAAARFGLGRVALLRGDARLAAEHFEATLAAQPAASIVHVQLAIAYRRLGQLDKAAAQAAAHTARQPAVRGSDAVRFPDLLLEGLEDANPSTGVRVADAMRELQEGRVALAKAAQDFHAAAAIDAKDVRIWLGLGQAEESLGDSVAAEVSYRRAVEVEPGNPMARLKLGTLLAQRGARPEGIEQLKVAVRLRPDSKEARFNLANALAQEGRLAEAEAESDALVKMAPQDAGARALRDQLRQDLGKQQPAKPPPSR